MSTLVPTPAQTFENDRLAVFRSHGLEARPERFSDPSGRETYLLRRGDGPCPTVLVHGGLADASVWSTMAGRLQGPLVIPDRPGCGLSYPMDYTGVDYRADAAEWMRRVVEHLGSEQVNLVGNSMGGYFSIAFATAYPDRVRNLVLPGAPAGLDRELPVFLRLLALPGLGSLLSKMQIDDPEKLRKQVFGGLVAHPDRIPDEVLRVAIANASFPASQRCVHTMLRTCASPLTGMRKHIMIRESMVGLPVRTLFLWGDRDEFAPSSSGEQIAAQMTDARVEVLEDVGHLPQFDAPQRLAELINEFLAGD